MSEEQEDYCIPATTERGVLVDWSVNGVGFGEFYFYMKDGKIYCDNETMDKDFIKQMLCQMVDDSILTEE